MALYELVFNLLPFLLKLQLTETKLSSKDYTTFYMKKLLTLSEYITEQILFTEGQHTLHMCNTRPKLMA